MASDSIRLVGQRPVQEPRDTAGSAWSCKAAGCSSPGFQSSRHCQPRFPAACLVPQSLNPNTQYAAAQLVQLAQPSSGRQPDGIAYLGRCKLGQPRESPTLGSRRTLPRGSCCSSWTRSLATGPKFGSRFSALQKRWRRRAARVQVEEDILESCCWVVAPSLGRMQRGWQIPDAPLKSCAGGMTALKSVSAFQKGFSCLSRPRAKSIPKALGSHRRISPTMKGVAEHSLVFQEQT